MSYLLDTNILSELRRGSRCDVGVAEWFAGCAEEELFTSVLCLGEIRLGIEAVRPRDQEFARRLLLWLDYLIEAFEGRILAVDQIVALEWGRAAAPSSVAPVDELLAATASARGFTLVTRSVRNVARMGIPVLNPFSQIH